MLYSTMPRLVQIETWFFGIIHCIIYKIILFTEIFLAIKCKIIFFTEKSLGLPILGQLLASLSYGINYFFLKELPWQVEIYV